MRARSVLLNAIHQEHGRTNNHCNRFDVSIKQGKHELQALYEKHRFQAHGTRISFWWTIPVNRCVCVFVSASLKGETMDPLGRTLTNFFTHRRSRRRRPLRDTSSYRCLSEGTCFPTGHGNVVVVAVIFLGGLPLLLLINFNTAAFTSFEFHRRRSRFGQTNASSLCSCCPSLLVVVVVVE